MGAAGTRERIIERNQYNPSDARKATRAIRRTGGMQQTFKRKGDIIIVNPYCKSVIVEKSGWY